MEADKDLKLIKYHEEVKGLIRPKACPCICPAMVYGFRNDQGKSRTVQTWISCCCRRTVYDNYTTCQVKRVLVDEGCCVHNDFAIESVGLFELKTNRYLFKIGDYSICCPINTLAYNLSAAVSLYPCCMRLHMECLAASGGFGGGCMVYEPMKLYDAMKIALYDDLISPSQQRMN
jgi:hypothetical protein